MRYGWWQTYEWAAAVAAVVCLLIVAGPFLRGARVAEAGEFENDLVLHVCFWHKARTALREGIDRSMVGGCFGTGVELLYGRKKEDERKGSLDS